MKYTWIVLLIVAAALFAAPSTTATAKESANTVVSGKDKTVTVYYFHTSRRCKTCLSIERVARGVVKDRFGDEKRVVFLSLDIEEEKNEKLVERFEIAGSSLLVCRGKKKSDLTTQAFQYALSDPGKLQKKLIAAIKAQLK